MQLCMQIFVFTSVQRQIPPPEKEYVAIRWYIRGFLIIYILFLFLIKFSFFNMHFVFLFIMYEYFLAIY